MMQAQKARAPIPSIGDMLTQSLASAIADEIEADGRNADEVLPQVAVSVAFFKNRLESDAARSTGGSAVEKLQQEFLNEAATYGITQRTAEAVFDSIWK